MNLTHIEGVESLLESPPPGSSPWELSMGRLRLRICRVCLHNSPSSTQVVLRHFQAALCLV
jgi:hypothetical protein